MKRNRLPGFFLIGMMVIGFSCTSDEEGKLSIGLSAQCPVTGNPSMACDVAPGPEAAFLVRWVDSMNEDVILSSSYLYGDEPWIWSELEGMTLLMDIYPGTNSNGDLNGSWIDNWTHFEGKAYFTASDGINGCEMWSYDGISPPQMWKDLNPGATAGAFGVSPHSGCPSAMLVHENKLYFTGAGVQEDTLMRMYIFYSLQQGQLTQLHQSHVRESGDGSLVYWLGKLYFAGIDFADWPESSPGAELYAYDITADSLALVADIYTGTYVAETVTYPNSSYPSELVVYDNRLYFSASHATSGRELWSYDGINPPVVYNIWPDDTDVNSSGPGDLTLYKGKLYFAANDPVNGYAELWGLEGNGSPTLVANINQDAPTYISSSGETYTSGEVSGLHVIGDKLYFKGHNSNIRTIYSYDGINPPLPLYDPDDIFSGLSIIEIVGVVGGKIFFKGNAKETGTALWYYDTTILP